MSQLERSVTAAESQPVSRTWAEELWELKRQKEAREHPQRKHTIVVPLTEKESAALSELSQRQDLPPERVMIQALRLYQFVALGKATVTMPEDENRCAAGELPA